MIKKTTTIDVAICDGCKGPLVDKYEPHNLQRGILKNDFGYGAKPAELDPCGANLVADYDLCGKCFVKACHAVGLPAHDGDKEGKRE